MDELPRRKPNRLDGYDYSRNGAYFITMCVKNRHEMLWERDPLNERSPVGMRIRSYPLETVYYEAGHGMRLSEYGQLISDAICAIPEHYANVFVDQFVVMPNHIHMILQIDDTCQKVLPKSNVNDWVDHRKGAHCAPAVFADVEPARTDFAPVKPARTDFAPVAPGRTDFAHVAPERADLTHVTPGRTDFAHVSPARADFAPVAPERAAPLHMKPNHVVLARVINQMKGSVTKQIGFSLWHKSYHDHIIQTGYEYVQISEYIQSNPENWENDPFYPTQHTQEKEGSA